MGVVDDVIAELQAQWNDMVIATANADFINGQLNSTSKTVPKIVVMEGTNDLKIASLNLTANIKKTGFNIKCESDSKNSTDKLVSECRRIIDAKAISSGWWHVDSVIFYESNAHAIGHLECSQTQFITASGWSYT